MHALDTLFSCNSKLFQILSECTIYCPCFHFCTTVPNCFKYCQNACIRYIVFMDFNAYFVFLAISITILIYTLGQTRSMPMYATDLNTFKWRLYMYKYIGLYVINFAMLHNLNILSLKICLEMQLWWYRISNFPWGMPPNHPRTTLPSHCL